jgi:V/A-type H+/Na+-transporting ATPase subunit D
MRMGGQMLRQASVGLKQSVAIRVVARSSVGVEYPSVSAEPLPLQPVGLMWTDVSFDEARLRLRELTVTLARLGEAENALWRLLAASRKTQKRVNALKYNIIPRYTATVQHIRALLEEDERNTLIQIKVLRARAEGWRGSAREPASIPGVTHAFLSGSVIDARAGRWNRVWLSATSAIFLK